MKRFLTGIFFLLTATVGAHDLDGGRRFGMSDAVLLSSPTATDMVACPAARLSAGQITLESGYLRRYDLSELDQYYAATALEYKHFLFALGVSQFGKSDYYTEKILRSAMSYRYDSLTIGFIAGGKLVEFGNREELFNSVELGFSAGFGWNRYHLAVVADNINKPRLAESSEPDYRTLNLYAEIEGSKYYSMVGRLCWEDYSPVRATLGQMFFLTGNNCLMWGISSNPLTYSGGLELSLKRYYISYAVANHPTLGLSHSIVIGIRNLR